MAPIVVSIERKPPGETTNSDTLTWRVTFSEDVQSVDAADFEIAGTTATLSVAADGTSMTVYDISATGGDLADLDDTVTLSLASGQNIEDLAGNLLDGATVPDPNENTFDLDNSSFAVESIVRQTPTEEHTDADTLIWRVTFNQDVDIINEDNFTITGTSATLSVAAEGGTSTLVFDVSATGGDLADLDDTVTLSISDEALILGPIVFGGIDEDGNLTYFLSVVDPSIVPGPNEVTYTIDNTAPNVASIVRRWPMEERTNADEVTWLVTFSEVVQGVDATDFELTGTSTPATLSVTPDGTSGTVYDVSATGVALEDLDGTVTLSLASGQDIRDLVGHALDDTSTPDPNDVTYVIDNTAPGVTSIVRQSPTVGRTNADTVTWRVTFNEAVGNVDAADFVIAGTTALHSVTPDGTSGTVYDVSATGGDLGNLNGTVTLSLADVAAGQNIEDLAGNALDTTSTPVTYVIDNTAPRVASIERQSPKDEHTIADEVTWRVTFSEAVVNVDAADFVIAGTTAELAVAPERGTSPTVYDVSATGGDLAGMTGTITLSPADEQNIEDLVGHALDTSPTPYPNPNADTYIIDNTAPVVTSIERLMPTAERTRADEVTWRVTFSEAVVNVDAADFALTGTTASLSVAPEGGTSPTIYEVSASGGDLGDLDGTITLSPADGNIKDFVGHALDTSPTPDPNANTYVIDNTVPVVASIERQSPKDERTRADEVTWRVTFSVAVVNVDAADFALTGTTASLSVAPERGTSPTVYDVSATGGDLAGMTGPITLSPADGNIRDLVGHDLDPTSTPDPNADTYVIDNTVPVVASIVRLMPESEQTGSDSLTWRVTFSEAVQDVDAADFALTGTTASLSVATLESTSRSIYDVSASGGDLGGLNGTVTLSLAGRQNIRDLVGNSLDGTVVPDPDADTFIVENTVPAVFSIVRHMPPEALTSADSLTWRVTFSEAVQDVDAADFALTGTTAGLTVAALDDISRTVYDISATGGDLAGLDGMATLSLAGDQDITDFKGGGG